MKKLVAVFALVAFLVAFIAVGLVLAKKTAPPLTCTTSYEWVGDFPSGHWEGPISGDIDGVIKWWLLSVAPHPAPPGQVGQMSFRWEIWNAVGDLLLAGEENERTIVRHRKNSVWRANGIVTEASAEYVDYIGSQMHDGGNFTWTDDDPPVPLEGSGTLRIAGSAGSE